MVSPPQHTHTHMFLHIKPEFACVAGISIMECSAWKQYQRTYGRKGGKIM